MQVRVPSLKYYTKENYLSMLPLQNMFFFLIDMRWITVEVELTTQTFIHKNDEKITPELHTAKFLTSAFVLNMLNGERRAHCENDQ